MRSIVTAGLDPWPFIELFGACRLQEREKISSKAAVLLRCKFKTLYVEPDFYFKPDFDVKEADCKPDIDELRKICLVGTNIWGGFL